MWCSCFKKSLRVWSRRLVEAPCNASESHPRSLPASQLLFRPAGTRHPTRYKYKQAQHLCWPHSVPSLLCHYERCSPGKTGDHPIG